MAELTRAEIIKQDKISELNFQREAQAAEDQAEFLMEQAEKLRNAARVAREHYQELENQP